MTWFSTFSLTIQRKFEACEDEVLVDAEIEADKKEELKNIGPKPISAPYVDKEMVEITGPDFSLPVHDFRTMKTPLGQANLNIFFRSRIDEEEKERPGK